MIKPTINELSQGKYNRYTLVIAAAKGAKMVTDEYVAQREAAEEMIANKQTEKPLFSLIDKDCRDEKAVKVALMRLKNNEYVIKNAPELDGTLKDETEEA